MCGETGLADKPRINKDPEVCPVIKETAEDSLYKGYVYGCAYSIWFHMRKVGRSERKKLHFLA